MAKVTYDKEITALLVIGAEGGASRFLLGSRCRGVIVQAIDETVARARGTGRPMARRIRNRAPMRRNSRVSTRTRP
jgi:hypothetical protein